MNIKKLPQDSIDLIAAGEVIERPVSVVKELLENSLDASSTKIQVELERGGTELIKVVDNGSGIKRSELKLAFQRFATNKIFDKKDLYNIKTLGFRGEALPSVVAVSDVILETKSADDEVGSYCKVDKVGVNEITPSSINQGTAITVQRLFRHLPVRLKFIKSINTETIRVQNCVANYALLYPQIAFNLIVDHKTRFRTTGTGELKYTIAEIYGRNLASEMVEFEYNRNSAFSVFGCISMPHVRRSNRQYITVGVNGRWIYNSRIIKALEVAFNRDKASNFDYPIAVAHLKIPVADIDVNVHPSKTEIKFLREDLVYNVVLRAATESLNKKTSFPSLNIHTRTENKRAPIWLAGWESSELKEKFNTQVGNRSPVAAETTEPQSKETETDDIHQDQSTFSYLENLEFVAQVKNKYLIVENDFGICMVDQHAIHERIIYEKLFKEMNEKIRNSQPLLAPQIFQIPVQHIGLMEKLKIELESINFEIDLLDSTSFVIRQVPVLLIHRSEVNFNEVVNDILSELSDSTPARWRHKILATIACHSSIRASEALTPQEAQSLLKEITNTTNPNTCPHGRPTMLFLSDTNINKQFGRI